MFLIQKLNNLSKMVFNNTLEEIDLDARFNAKRFLSSEVQGSITDTCTGISFCASQFPLSGPSTGQKSLGAATELLYVKFNMYYLFFCMYVCV